MPSRREFLKQTAAAASGIAGVVAAASAQAEATAAGPKTLGNTLQVRRSGPLKLAIVGTGQISHRYLKQAAAGTRAGQRARFVATCARRLKSAKARAVEYGIGAWFDDYQKMYDKAKPDAVVIATPSALHAAPAIAALERGIHVLCEKPMATRFEDCQAMVAAAQKSGAVFLALPYDATPAFRAALAHLNETTLGVFTGADAQLLIGDHPRDNWYYDRNVAGGVMLDTLVYPVSRLVSLLGPARRVTGSVNTLIPHRLLGEGKRVESTIDDNVSLVIDWPGGQQAVARALWGVSIFRGDAVIYGRHGTLWLEQFGTDVVLHSPKRAIPHAEPITWHNQKDCYRVPVPTLPQEDLIEHFVDCIEGKSQPTCGGPQALHVHEILFKGYEAARSGKVQDLETSFTPWHKIDSRFHDTRSRPI